MIENLDIKIHNQITQYGSKVGVALKFFKEKEPMVNEKIDQDSSRIDKNEDIITNLGSAFSSVKNTPPNANIAKLMYIPKNKGETSSKETADLKSISIHPNLFAIIKEPFSTNDFFDLVPKSFTINKKKEIPKDGRCLIEELPTKDGNT